MVNKEQIIRDFKKFRFINSFEKNPASNKIIFKEVKVNYDKNDYESNVFLYDDGKFEKIKTHKKPIKIKFYDNYKLLYTTKISENIKKHRCSIYIQNISNKRIYEEIKLHFEVSDFFVIDNENILLQSDEKINDFIEEEDFKYEIDRINFVENGEGYTYNKINKLYLYNFKENKLLKLSRDDENVEVINFDNENKRIYYISKSIKGVYCLFNKPYLYDVNTKDNICLYDKDDVEFTYITSLDNDIIAIASYQKNYGINENPKFYKICNNDLFLYCENEYSIGNSVNSDIRYGSSTEIKKHKNAIYFLSTRNNKCSIYKLENKNIELYFNGITCVDGYEFLKDRLIIYGFDKQCLQEIYMFKTQKLNRLTNFSDKFGKHIKSYKIEELEYMSNGDLIRGYILYPDNFDKNNKYPAVLTIHGGPKTVYIDNFIYEMHLLAKMGYFVIFTNPHGSDCSDNKYADIRGEYGKKDYEDLMNFMDETIKKYENIDSERLAVMGGSYGGYMTNHIIGNTNKFKVAITQRSISNWISFYSTSDIGYYFSTDQNACNFNIEKLWRYSPLSNVSKIKTPTLIIHSDEDYRCPLEQAVQLFTHLKINNVKTKLIIYKGENHDLSRNGKIKSRISRLLQILNWLEENL